MGRVLLASVAAALLCVQSLPAFAQYTVDTWLDYDGSSLQRYSETSGGVYDEQCYWEPWDGGDFPIDLWVCSGQETIEFRVDTWLYAPGGVPVLSLSDVDPGFASVSYLYDPGTNYGTWVAVAEHHARERWYQETCFPPGFTPPPPLQQCQGFVYIWDENLGTTMDEVDVLPPPPPGLVEVEYVMFIPFDHIRLPGTTFQSGMTYSGDNQPTYSSGASYRVLQAFTINTVTGQIQNPVHSPGTTNSFTPAEYFLSPAAFCYRKMCPNCPQYPNASLIVFDGNCQDVFIGMSCSAPAGQMNTLLENVTGQSPTSVTVEFTGDPNNACVSGSPGITWQNTITISWSNGSPTYTLNMDHDGFPMHEVRINGVLVYAHDPFDSPGYTPFDLGTSPDIQDTVNGALP